MAAFTPQADPTAVEPYRMHVSARYLDLTRRKLELTRLPREIPLPKERRWALGTPKDALEPLIDYWLEMYDWRQQETALNDALQQYRTTIQYPPKSEMCETESDDEEAALSEESQTQSLRIHFVHQRSSSPNAVPLLFCHGWPGSFLEVLKCVEPLVNPIETPRQAGGEQVSFHVVAPSIPGFSFSDASNKENFGAEDTAAIYAALMKRLEYDRYVVYGDGWGFKVARMLALHHPYNCRAVHTSFPVDLPAPQALKNRDTWLKYHIAKLTGARFHWLSFGYVPSDFDTSDLTITDTATEEATSSTTTQARPSTSTNEPRLDTLGATTTNSMLPTRVLTERPQTLSFGLCDSPSGLLAILLDALKPKVPTKAQAQSQSQYQTTYPPPSQDPTQGQLQAGSRRRSSTMIHRAPAPPPPTANPPFSATEVLNWTMMHWLPGPEASLRWLLAVEKEDCYAAYSSVPLGISWYATSSATPSPAATTSSKATASSSVQARTRASGSRSPSPAGTGAASPMWAEAIQRLVWVRRRLDAVESGVPAWERSAEVVVDLREFVAEGRREGWLVLGDGGGSEQMRLD